MIQQIYVVRSQTRQRPCKNDSMGLFVSSAPFLCPLKTSEN